VRDSDGSVRTGEGAGRHLSLVEGGGASNSRPTDTNVRPRPGAGFDTVRFRYREQRDVYERARASGRAAIHARGELRRVVDGVTLGAFPSGMAYVEGRAAAILNGSEDHGLVDVSTLETAALAGADLVGADANSAELAALGRMDLTSELLLDDPREGVELLSAAQHVDLPWLKTTVDGLKRGVPQSVSWRTLQGRSIVLRLYDKGVETGQAPPGMWVRLERQRRARKDRERTIAQAQGAGLRESFVGRELDALLAGEVATTVCDRWGAVEQVRELVERRIITRRTGELLCGHLALGSTYEPYKSRRARESARRTLRRREERLRKLGIALDPIAESRRVVHVSDYLRRFVDRFDEAIAA
jgi:hypothetical protein